MELQSHTKRTHEPKLCTVKVQLPCPSVRNHCFHVNVYATRAASIPLVPFRKNVSVSMGEPSSAALILSQSSPGVAPLCARLRGAASPRSPDPIWVMDSDGVSVADVLLNTHLLMLPPADPAGHSGPVFMVQVQWYRFPVDH